MAPDAAVIVAVEVLRRDQVGDAVERLVVDQQRAEQRLLGLDRMRRQVERDELLIGRVRARYRLCHGHRCGYIPEAEIIETRGALSICLFETPRPLKELWIAAAEKFTAPREKGATRCG